MEGKPSKPIPIFLLGAPLKMAVSVLLGVGFMLGHYFFYHSLNGQPTPDAGYNIWGGSFSVSGQQVNIGIGSLFALLVKTTLGFAIGTALDQVTWRQIRAEPTKVATVDDVLSIPSALFTLANLKLWRRYTLAMLAGVILWLLPIISVVTPATLTVRSTSYNETSAERVPRVDYASLKLASFGNSEDGYFLYDGPQLDVQTVAQSVAAGGDVLSVTPPFPNSSWHLDFYGPALDCHNIDQSSRTEILDNIQQNNNCSDGTVYGYLSWVRTAYDWDDQPHTVTVPDSIVPFDEDTGDLETGTLGPAYGDGFDGTAPLTLYMAVLPEMLKRTYTDDYFANDSYCPKPSTFVANATVLECTLYNTSYSGNFTFVNGVQQSVNFTRGRVLNNVTYVHKIYDGDLNTAEAQINAQSDLKTLSYQAVMDALGRVLVGAIGLAQTRLAPGTMSAPTVTHGLNITDTSVMSTVVGSVAELAFLANYTEHNGPVDPVGGLSTTISRSTAGQSLPEIIEGFFENITLSMMSSDSLQFNYSSKLAPANVPVTLTQIANLYSFSKAVLWATYGVALLLTLGVVAVGLYAHVASHGSYTSKFSTILRTTHGATLSTSIEVVDENGQDPLPRYIADSTIALASTGATGGDDGDDGASGSSGLDRRRRPYHAVEQGESDD
ncbi:hypothetical protein BJX66DRAFT_337459 [Aspergillus keveii]|uniref:Integral membrane protein n=1 Tax=Aspergillus keveii TaxID=714993 RepID=A0ABR4G828_9EURO